MTSVAHQLIVTPEAADQSHNAIAQAAMNVMFNSASGAAVLMLANRCLANFDDALIRKLLVSTTARSVVISPDTQNHITKNRQVSSKQDADLVTYRLHEALKNLRYWRLPQRDSLVFDLVGFVPSSKRHLLVALKLVRTATASSSVDEWWIKTAYPYGRKSLRHAAAAGKLIPLRDESDEYTRTVGSSRRLE